MIPDDLPPSLDTGTLDAAPLDEAFRVADRLAVHGAECVCPRCAGRLPGLLMELAHALP
jgi:hypothetical protein